MTTVDVVKVQSCAACGSAFLEAPANRCAACGSPDLARRDVRGEGIVAAATTVRLAPPGVEVPYTIAYADFDGGVRLLGRVDTVVGAGDAVRLHTVDDLIERFRFVAAVA